MLNHKLYKINQYVKCFMMAMSVVITEIHEDFSTHLLYYNHLTNSYYSSQKGNARVMSSSKN